MSGLSELRPQNNAACFTADASRVASRNKSGGAASTQGGISLSLAQHRPSRSTHPLRMRTRRDARSGAGTGARPGVCLRFGSYQLLSMMWGPQRVPAPATH